MRLNSLLVSALATLLTTSAQAAPELYTVAEASGGNTVAIGGSVVPAQEVKLAAQLPGRIAILAGREGQRFEQGTVLVALDDAELQAQRAAAQAAIDAADAGARGAQAQYSQELVNPQSERAGMMPGMAMPGMMDQMFTRPMASMMGMENPGMQRGTQLYQQGTQVRQAHSGVAQAQAQLEQIDAKLRDSQGIAPFAGTIISKQIEIGDTVQPGQPLLTFADLDHLQIRSDVPSRLSLALHAGQSVRARLDGGRVVTTTVAQVFPVADAQRHTVVVKFDLPEGVAAAPGMYADVLIPDPDDKGPALPVVPRSALIWRGSLPGVMRLDASGTPQLKLIRISDRGDPDTVQVFAGLKAGDQIVANPE
ncbi:MAG: efflux RND transporter periplasmic adaptor subunit [Chromatiales bacterium]|nr:efflux RND transporter periplasmic adaptor subunit [Gammaproteobacteria bacterium]MCP5352116.1 efflux RND transporter periplasmic adaptor subunit [Chromatiales bacterium]